jgi:teichuronic acid biosynthesis glycosyltransferase TuaH
MIYSKNIVCVSNTTWEGFYTKSTVQILSLLGKRNKVLFVEYPFTFKDLVSTMLGKGRAPVSRMLGSAKRLIAVKTSFDTTVHHLVIPPLLPVEFIKIEPLYKLLLKLNTLIYARSVRRALRKLEMHEPVCINAYNAIYGKNMAGKLNEKLNLFYCYDGPNTSRYGPRATDADQSFAELVDGVIVTSEFLASSMKEFNQEIHVVKNGVDFGIFKRDVKTGLNNIGKRKKVGYIGSLDQRFDIDTIEYSIQQLPKYDFEFVGELMNKTIEQRLSVYKNVKFISPVKPNEVPGLLHKCDVGLIPYICNEYTKNIYPLKINEYLSVGVPVVLTSFAELPEFNEIVSFASGKKDFCNAIVREIENDSLESIKKRIQFAEKNSWENRAELFEDIIDRLLEKKSKSN